MSDVKWIKIMADIFNDDKIMFIEEMPEADSIIVIWFKLLCLAGIKNNSGVFMFQDTIPYTEKMLATVFRRKESTVKLALEVFEQFGMIEIVNGAITIPNWGKYQNFDKLEQKTEYMRNYMRDYREKQKQIACKANSKTNGKANSKANVSEADKNRIEEDKIREEKETLTSNADPFAEAFDQFWVCYPKKKNKADAVKAFKKAIKKAPLEQMLTALDVQMQTTEWKKEDGRYIPYPSTWLNGERWNDDVTPAEMKGTRSIYDEIDSWNIGGNRHD